MFNWTDTFHTFYWISESKFTGHRLVTACDDFGNLTPVYWLGEMLLFGSQEH